MLTPRHGDAEANWFWWSVPRPLARTSALPTASKTPRKIKWHAAAHTNHILSLMSPLNRKKVSDASASGRKWLVPCIGAPVPTKTVLSASALKSVSTISPAASGLRRVAQRVRYSWWLTAGQDRRGCCRRAKRRDSWVLTIATCFLSATITPFICGDGVACRLCGILPSTSLLLLVDRETSERIAAE